MKPQIRHTILALVATGTAVGARAQSQSQLPDEDQPEPLGIRIRVQGRVQFGLQAKFTDTKAALSTAPGQFGDGYVLIGSNTSTNAAGVANPGAVTWNWGYDNASQAAGGNLTLTRYDNVPRVGTLDGGSSTAFGGELFGMYELYAFRAWSKKTAHWGLEAGYGYTMFDASASGSANGTATRNRSVYSLGGIVPPAPGYRGNYDGPIPGGPPAPILDFAPVGSSSVSSVGVNNLAASASTDLHSVKLGPWVELPLTEHLTLTASAGFCTVLAQADLSFTESSSFTNPALAGAAPGTLVANASRQDWRPGFYAQTSLDFRITEHWSAFGGIQLQSNPDLKFSTLDRGVEIQLGSVFGATAGVQFSF
jgi:hypothetical protein